MKNKLFYKYLITYILVFSLPVLFLICFVTNNLMDNLEDSYRNKTITEVKYTKDYIDQTFSNIQNLTDMLNTNSYIVGLNIVDVNSSIDLINNLTSLTIANPYIVDTMLYIEGDEFVYTSSTTMSLDNIYDNHHYHINFNDDYFDYIKTAKNSFLLPQYTYNSPNNSSLLLLSDKIHSTSVDAWMVYILDMDKIFQLVNSDIALILVDDYGNVIGHNSFATNFINNNKVETLDDNQYLVTAMQFSQYNSNIIQINSLSNIFADYFETQQNYINIILAVIFLGITLASISTYINYRPINKIRLFAYNMTKEKIIKDLTHGRLKRNEFLSVCKEYNLEYFKYKRFYIIIFEIKPANNKDLVTEDLEKLMQNYLGGYLKESSIKGRYVHIGTTSELTSESYSFFAESAWANLEMEYSTPVSFAVSDLFDDFDTIRNVYKKVSSAVEYSFVKGVSCFVESSSLGNSEINFEDYSGKTIEKLKTCIRIGDSDKIDVILDEFRTYIKQSQLPLFCVKGICYQLINNFSIFFESLQIATKSQIKNTHIFEPENFKNVDELIDAISNICHGLNTMLQEKQNNTKKQLIDEYISFLDENVYKSDFSVQSMAEHFGISLSALSTFFKNSTGVKIIDKVSILRMEKAKEFLNEGYKVNEVVELVGYYNPSSFIRKFKEYTGVTPGQFVKSEKGIL